jgi:hypothetical protein
MKAATIGIRKLVDYSIWIMEHQQAFWRHCRGHLC